MRGRITFINPATQTSIIFGPEQTRYRFRVADWQGTGLPPRNVEVDFTVSGGDAIRVKPFQNMLEEEDAIEEMASPVADMLTATLDRPGVSAVTESESDLSPEEAFEAGLPTRLLPIQEPVVKPAATPFVAAPFTTPPLTAKLAYPEDVARPSYPGWKLYLIGFGATMALVVIGLIVTHL